MPERKRPAEIEDWLGVMCPECGFTDPVSNFNYTRQHVKGQKARQIVRRCPNCGCEWWEVWSDDERDENR